MRFVYLMIVLGFPLLDLYATVRFARWTGVPVWAWLGLSVVAGFLLLRNERIAFRARTIAAMHGEHAALRELFDSGRKVLAGFLLLLPGVISDVLALVLLALPLNVGRSGYAPSSPPRPRARPRATHPERRIPPARLANPGRHSPTRLTRRMSRARRGPRASPSVARRLRASARGARDTPTPSSRRRRRSSAATATGPS